MGLLTALDLAFSDRPLEEKIRIHLSVNFLEDIGEEWYPICVLAVNLASDRKASAEISLPDGVNYKGSGLAPASVIIDNFHLNLFVDYGEEGVEESE